MQQLFVVFMNRVVMKSGLEGSNDIMIPNIIF